MDAKFKEYIKQGIGIWIGFLVASVSFAVIVALLWGGVALLGGAVDVANDAMEYNARKSEEKRLKKEHEEMIARAKEAQQQKEKELAEAKAKAEVELAEKLLLMKNTATKEILIDKNGVCILELTEGKGCIRVFDKNDKERRSLVNVKTGDTREIEVEAGEKITLPENAKAIWGIKQ